MNNQCFEKLALSGAPLIGEGNIVDIQALVAVLTHSGIRSIDFYPNGPMVFLARRYHIDMTMSTKKTMDYALNSEGTRSSLAVTPLRWELRRAVRKAYKTYPNAMCFITSQNIIAEESVKNIGNASTIVVSSDVSGKVHHHRKPSETQQGIHHLVWNREALSLYQNELNMQNVHLIRPVDPKDAFHHIERAQLPYQKALEEANLCFIKLSGSGGDPKLINAAIISLWKRSKIKSIVFPGTKKTQSRIIRAIDENVHVNSCLNPAVFYNHAREIISNEQMLLTYPSEQVKHIAILTQNNIFPKIVWLPPRGYHEMINLAWAIQQKFSGTVCIPGEYRSQLYSSLMKLGVHPSEFECIEPDRLSAEHFKPSPVWKCEPAATALDTTIRKIVNFS